MTGGGCWLAGNSTLLHIVMCIYFCGSEGANTNPVLKGYCKPVPRQYLPNA